MEVEKTWRLKYIIHGLRESRKRFHKTLEAQEGSMSSYVSLNELLLWINISDEWHYKNTDKPAYKERKKSCVEGRYVDGLRFPFNSEKHEMSYIKLFRPIGAKELIKGLSPIEDYSTDLIWLEVDKLIPDKAKKTNKNELQFKQYYIDFVQGKTIVETVDGACRFLEGLYAEIKESEYRNKV